MRKLFLKLHAVVPVFLALVSLMLVACQMEGPLSDLTIHHGTSPTEEDELTSFSAAVTDGVVDGDAYVVTPQLLLQVEGKFSHPLYLSYRVDDGPSTIKGPVKIGEPVKYDINDKVYPVGEHVVKGKIYYNDEEKGEVTVTIFEDSFVITAKDVPVEPDYLVSVVYGSNIIPLSTTEVKDVPAGTACTLKVDFKGKGTGVVKFSNINYTFSLLDFDFARKDEGEGVATIPMTTKGTGDAFITVTFTRNGKTYKPTFQILLKTM